MPSSYPYWRVYVTAVQGHTNTSFAEVEFRSVVGGPSVATGGTALSSGDFAGRPASNAFDGSTATMWTSSGASPNWIGYHFASSVAIAQIRLVAINDATFYDQAATAFEVQGSVDGVTWAHESWILSGVTWSGALQSQTFTNPDAGIDTGISASAVALQTAIGGHDDEVDVGAVVHHTAHGSSPTEAWSAAVALHSVRGGTDVAALADMVVMHTAVGPEPWPPINPETGGVAAQRITVSVDVGGGGGAASNAALGAGATQAALDAETAARIAADAALDTRVDALESAPGGVSSVFGRTGAVVAQSGDYAVGDVTGAAPLASPTFTGTPAAPTAAGGTNTTQVATTAYVQGELAAKAPLASPALTGTPTAPTAAVGTNTTQLATTAFVLANAGGGGSSPAWVTNHPDTPPTSPTTFGGTVYDQEFVRDNALGAGSTILGAPATNPSVVDRALRVVSGTSGSADVKGIEWACPGSAFTMTAKMRRKIGSGTFGNFGIMLRRNASGAGNFVFALAQCSSVYTTLNVAVDKYTALTTRSSFGSTTNFSTALWREHYLQWVYDGTNITASFSFTGHPDSFFQVFTETAATFLGGAPGRYGIVIDNFGTTANTGYCEWIRFT